MIYLTSLFYFFYFAVIGIYIIFFPKILQLSGYSASQIGILFSAAPLVRFLVPFLFVRGFKLGRSSFHTALIILSLSVLGIRFSLENFYALLLSNIFFGVGLSLILPYIELISLQEIGKERYGKSRLFGSIGFMGVALVLVRIMQEAQTALLFLIVLSYITVLFAFLVVRRSHAKQKENNHTESLESVALLKEWRLWLGFALLQVSFGAFYNFFTIYETAHGISLEMTVYLWSFGVLIEIIMLYFQGALLRKNLLVLLQLTTFVTIIRWLLVYFFAANLPFLFLSQSLHALSFALFHSAAISYLYQHYKNKALAQQLFSGISYGLGALLGALLSGYIYQYFPSQLFLFSALFAALSFWCIHSYAKTQNS